MKKYEFTGETKEYKGRILHRIKALRNFRNVIKGDLGGWIEKESNLSHEGICWVYDEAMVFDNAQVRDNVAIRHKAKIYGNARIYGDARICNNVQIYEEAKVYEYAEIYDNVQIYGKTRICGKSHILSNVRIYDRVTICGNARIYGNAQIYENACIWNKAKVYGNAKIYGNAMIYDEAEVFDNAKVYDFANIYGNALVFENAQVYNIARVYGNAKICGNAQVFGEAYVKYGELTKDIKEDLVQYIACSLGVYPINGKYILYKRVNKITEGKYVSLFNPDFIYEDGKIAEVKNYNSDFENSCSSGIHCSTPFYWGGGNTLIAVEVKVEDIITCMAGKVRAKKVKVLGEVGGKNALYKTRR